MVDFALEEWRDTISAYGIFQASSEGRVRSVGRRVSTGKGNGRWVKPAIKNGSLAGAGYLMCSYRLNGKVFPFYFHRLVAEAFCQNPDAKPCVNHIDGDKRNNRPANLEWVTNLENMQHAKRLGLLWNCGEQRLGELNPVAKLNDNEVSIMKRRILDGDPIALLAMDFGISTSQIYHIKNGRYWRHVAPAERGAGQYAEAP